MKLYDMSQKAMFDSEPLMMVIQRLKGVKMIHDESPSIQPNMDQIKVDTEKIDKLHQKTKGDLKEFKADMAKEFDSIFKELDECDKQISAKS